MTSATVRPSRGTDDRRGQGRGLLVFASVLLMVVGFFNFIDGIAAVADSHFFVANAHYVIGDLRTWGWCVMLLGALQIVVAFGVLYGNQVARWTAVALIGLNAIAQMMFLPSYPLWSLTIIAIDVVALWGLCAYGGPEYVGE
jgi:hypothetical protein